MKNSMIYSSEDFIVLSGINTGDSAIKYRFLSTDGIIEANYFESNHEVRGLINKSEDEFGDFLIKFYKESKVINAETVLDCIIKKLKHGEYEIY